MAAEVEYICFVGGLAWATTDRTLTDAFSTYGDVVNSKIINDRETGRSRGFGFINGQEFDGRNITVNEAQARGSGFGGGWRCEGGGGGYGRGGSYGGSGVYGGGVYEGGGREVGGGYGDGDRY